MSEGYRRYISEARRRLALTQAKKAQVGERQRQSIGKDHTNECGEDTLVEKPDKACPPDQQGQHSHEAKPPPSTRAEIAIAWFTGALLFVGVVGAVATYLQWDAAKKALTFAKESAESSAADTKAALKITDRVATATETQAVITAGALRATNRIATANERSVGVAESDLRLKKTNDLDVADISYGLQEQGWKTTFRVSVTGTLPAKDVAVSVFAGWGAPREIDKIWDQTRGTQLFNILPDNPHNFDVTAGRRPSDISALASGRAVAITAIKLIFIDGNGERQERRGCVFYSSETTAHTCDKN